VAEPGEAGPQIFTRGNRHGGMLGATREACLAEASPNTVAFAKTTRPAVSAIMPRELKMKNKTR